MRESLIREVRVGESIIIEGDNDARTQDVAKIARSKGAVPSFDRKWCPIDIKDGHSNHWRISVDLP